MCPCSGTCEVRILSAEWTPEGGSGLTREAVVALPEDDAFLAARVQEAASAPFHTEGPPQAPRSHRNDAEIQLHLLEMTHEYSYTC